MLIDLLLAVGRFVDRLFAHRPRGEWPPLRSAGPLRIDAERAEDEWAARQAVAADPRGEPPVRLSEHDARQLAEDDAARDSTAPSGI